jgi:hypothetical protein
MDDSPISTLLYPADALGREVGRMLMEMNPRGVTRLPGRYASGAIDFRTSLKPSMKKSTTHESRHCVRTNRC